MCSILSQQTKFILKQNKTKLNSTKLCSKTKEIVFYFLFSSLFCFVYDKNKHTRDHKAHFFHFITPLNHCFSSYRLDSKSNNKVVFVLVEKAKNKSNFSRLIQFQFRTLTRPLVLIINRRHWKGVFACTCKPIGCIG